jgi:hypothetical protein
MEQKSTARTPSAHWVSDFLNRRVPYTDRPFKEQHNPHEISLGHGHREIAHLIEIIADPKAAKAPMIQALRLLTDVLAGRQAEAIEHNAFDALHPLLKQPPGGLLLYSLVCLDTLIVTITDAQVLSPDIPQIVEIVDPKIEPPLRIAAATLLRHIADLLGPIKEFVEGDVPIKLVAATASVLTKGDLLPQLFDLLARLTNVQAVRVPIIRDQRLLEVIVGAIADPVLQAKAVNLAENIAMDSSNGGKRALLDTDILDKMPPLLVNPNVNTRIAAVSLIALLAVPKEGKERIAMSREIADALKKISESDADLYCRRSACKVWIIVAELPFGREIVGQVVDPSIPVGMPTSEQQSAGVKRANPKIGENPDTMLLSPRSAEKIVQPTAKHD